MCTGKDPTYRGKKVMAVYYADTVENFLTLPEIQEEINLKLFGGKFITVGEKLVYRVEFEQFEKGLTLYCPSFCRFGMLIEHHGLTEEKVKEIISRMNELVKATPRMERIRNYPSYYLVRDMSLQLGEIFPKGNGGNIILLRTEDLIAKYQTYVVKLAHHISSEGDLLYRLIQDRNWIQCFARKGGMIVGGSFNYLMFDEEGKGLDKPTLFPDENTPKKVRDDIDHMNLLAQLSKSSWEIYKMEEYMGKTLDEIKVMRRS